MVSPSGIEHHRKRWDRAETGIVNRLRQLADVSQSKPDQTVVARSHLRADRGAGSLLGREPMQVERLLCWFAVTLHRHDIRKADRVVTRIVKPGSFGIREILDDRERSRINRDPGQSDRAEIFLTMAKDGLSHSLAK